MKHITENFYLHFLTEMRYDNLFNTISKITSYVHVSSFYTFIRRWVINLRKFRSKLWNVRKGLEIAVRYFSYFNPRYL